MTVLSVRDLEVTYTTQAGPIPAVRGVSLEIEKGEVLGLAGESGCGKSTVVNAILRPTFSIDFVAVTLTLE